MQLISRTSGDPFDELNTGFSTDIRCAGMYPYVACTDYSMVKVWKWDPLLGTVASLYTTVTET